jgi:hypothetical protein
MNSNRNPPFAILFLVICLTGCGAKSPAPPQVLDDLKAYVENDGRQVRREDIFSMPSSLGTNQPPGDEVQVTSVRYDRTDAPLNQPSNGIPSGTVLHTYEIWDTRVKPDGSKEREQRWFYVYADSSGQWHFVKRMDNPYE